MIAARNPEFGRTVLKLREMSASEKARERYDRSQKAERDLIMFTDHAEKKGEEKGEKKRGSEIEQNLIEMGISPEQIATALKSRE